MDAPSKKPPERPSPVLGTVLAAVLERPGYGYDVALRVQEKLGPAWELPISTVYGLLARLEDQGLVRREVREVPGDGFRPPETRVTHYATERAEEARRSWLTRPTRRQTLRSEMMAKLASARPGDEPLILAALDEYERDILRMLEAYGRDERPREPGLTGVMMASMDDGVTALLRADRQWVSRTKRRIMEHRDERG